MNELDAAEAEELRRERRRRRHQKLTACCKSAVAFLFSHIGLAAMVVAYSIMGGFLFQAIEAPAEQSTKYRVRDARQHSVDEMWRLAAQMCDRRRRRRSPTVGTPDATVAGLDATYAAKVGAVLLEFQNELLHAVQDLGWDGNDDLTESKLQWSFAGALLYAVTVITTIGYGHIAPKTTLGRIITIIYALLGIPLTFLYLSNIGNFMANCFRIFYKRVCCDILCCQKCDRNRQRSRLKQRRQREMAVQRNILLGLHPALIGCSYSSPAAETAATSCNDLTRPFEAQMRQISTENVADFRSNSPSKHSSETDTGNAAEHCATGSGCRNGCQTPPEPCVSTRRFSPPSSIRDNGSSTTLASSSSSGVTETGSGRTNCSTPPGVDDDKGSLMTSPTCAVRETAIVDDSSDERLDRSGNCRGDVISGDVIFGSSVIRQPLCETNNSSRPSHASSDLLYRDFVSCLDYGPETDILFSESASDVAQNSQVIPEVETYLRLPPASPYGHNVNRFDDLLATDAAGQNKATEKDNRQVDIEEYPEVNSTTTTTTTMSLGRRSSSVGAISRVGVDFGVLSSSSLRRRSSFADRKRRLHAPETGERRQLTSPLERNAVTETLSAGEARRARARALVNWAKLREQFGQHQVAVDEPRLRAAALKLFQDEVVRRSRSSDRHGTRRLRRTSSSRDRRRCISIETSTKRARSRGIQRSNTVDTGNHLPFRPAPDRQSRLSDPGGTDRLPISIPASGSMDDVSVTVDLASATASGAVLPYDYEPLSFDDGGSVPFSYTDDPFDYDDNGSHDGGKVTVPITICLVIIAGYIFAGAVLFTLWEDWDYVTGSYFCFITLSTIGFGDIVPGTDMDKWASSEKLVLCALWLAFGLSLLAMCFNLMQEEVKEKCKCIGLRLGLLRDDEPQ